MMFILQTYTSFSAGQFLFTIEIITITSFI